MSGPWRERFVRWLGLDINASQRMQEELTRVASSVDATRHQLAQIDERLLLMSEICEALGAKLIDSDAVAERTRANLERLIDRQEVTVMAEQARLNLMATGARLDERMARAEIAVAALAERIERRFRAQ